jgi:hypothetical protein
LQAFAVVLPYVLDVKTLLVCSTLSQQSQQLVQDAVRLNLAPLVKQLPKPAQACLYLDRVEALHNAWLQLQWMCSTAGPASVNTDSNTCAILWSLHNMHVDKAERTAGVQQQPHCPASFYRRGVVQDSGETVPEVLFVSALPQEKASVFRVMRLYQPPTYPIAIDEP